MKITKINSDNDLDTGLVFYYLDSIDQNRVNRARDDPRVRVLAKKYGLYRTLHGLDFSLLTEKNNLDAYGISIQGKFIVVNEKRLQTQAAEEITQLVLGESLSKAVREFRGQK